MQRISSTSPHKIQPHQKDTLNHKQKLLAKRAAAKVVRRKINESQQISKSNIMSSTSSHNSETASTVPTQNQQTKSIASSNHNNGSTLQKPPEIMIYSQKGSTLYSSGTSKTTTPSHQDIQLKSGSHHQFNPSQA